MVRPANQIVLKQTKKFVAPKTEKEILKSHPIASNINGWFMKVVEISNNAFVVEAADLFGGTISRQGSNPNDLQEEIENELGDFSALR